MTPTRFALLQLDLAWEDPPRNFEVARAWIATAARAGAQVVVLPEMFSCGFSMATERIAEPFDGSSAQFLREMAAVHDVIVCGSAPERPDPPDPSDARPFNTLLLARPDGSVQRYRKRHPFSFAREDEHYRAGHERVIVDIHGLRVALLVCYDLRFADEFWDLAPSVDAYVVVANWPERRRAHWSTLLRARAIENQAYVVGVNRVGTGSELTYTGDSVVVGPWGEVLCEGGHAPTMLLADLDRRHVAAARATFPVLTDRRPPPPWKG